jgi:hypothetical protein
MLVILATQEAAVKRVMVQSQPRANSSHDPIPKKTTTEQGWWSGSRCRPRVQTPVPRKKKIVVVLKTKSALGMVVHAYNPSNSTGRGRRLTSLRPCDHMTRPCLKKTKS